MPHSTLVVEFVDGRTWRLREPMQASVGGRHYCVPAGFETDFASIPRFFWRVMPPTGRYAPAAVLHDWFYREGIARRRADRLFYEVATDDGVSIPTATILWLAVRWFGWLYWRRKRKTRERTMTEADKR